MDSMPFTPAAMAAALYRLAQLMDEDDARTGKVGIPVSYGHRLVWLAVIGTYEAWEAEWVRLARAKSTQAAAEWSGRQEAQIRHLVDLVYPGGATARAKSAVEVRALADSLATDPARNHDAAGRAVEGRP